MIITGGHGGHLFMHMDVNIPSCMNWYTVRFVKFSKLILESEPCNAPLFLLPSCLSAAYTWVLLQRFLYILP